MKSIVSVGVMSAALATLAGTAQAAEEGKWMVRARALYMNVDNDNSGGLALPLQVKAENRIFPEVDFSYFFTPNVAAELILT